MSETTTKAPRRTSKEIAQSHADKALAALAKHDTKIEKAQAKAQAANDAFGALVDERAALVREADYRQAHPLLQEDEVEVGRFNADGTPYQPADEAGDHVVTDDEDQLNRIAGTAAQAEPGQDDNPFA